MHIGFRITTVCSLQVLSMVILCALNTHFQLNEFFSRFNSFSPWYLVESPSKFIMRHVLLFVEQANRNNASEILACCLFTNTRTNTCCLDFLASTVLCFSFYFIFHVCIHSVVLTSIVLHSAFASCDLFKLRELIVEQSAVSLCVWCFYDTNIFLFCSNKWSNI